jgi:hypothetical protein
MARNDDVLPERTISAAQIDADRAADYRAEQSK